MPNIHCPSKAFRIGNYRGWLHFKPCFYPHDYAMSLFYFIVNGLRTKSHPRITTSLSAPDSGRHTSAGPPRIWRTRASAYAAFLTVSFTCMPARATLFTRASRLKSSILRLSTWSFPAIGQSLHPNRTLVCRSSGFDIQVRLRFGLHLNSIQIATPAAISSITGSGSCPTTGLAILTLDQLIWMRDTGNPFREFIRAKSAQVSGNRSCSDSYRGSAARCH